jgi:hypothetical protein
MILSILFMLTTSLTTQTEYASYDYGQFVPGSPVLLFGDKVNIREEPSINAGVVATLTIGHPMEIIAEAETQYTVNDFTTNWYEVAFEHEGEVKEGYVWGGLLSIVSLPLESFDEDNFDIFVFGITEFVEEEGFTGEARIAKDGKIISRVSFDIIGHMQTESARYSHSISGIALSDAGFSQLENIFVLSFMYEACGVTNGDVLLFWNGSSISYGTNGVSVSEADVFSQTFDFYFPYEIEGSPNVLIYIQTYDEYYDEISPEHTVILYQWNGKTLEQMYAK